MLSHRRGTPARKGGGGSNGRNGTVEQSDVLSRTRKPRDILSGTWKPSDDIRGTRKPSGILPPAGGRTQMKQSIFEMKDISGFNI